MFLSPFPPWTLEIFLEIFLVVATGEDLTTEFCYQHIEVEARDVTKHPTVQRTDAPPCQKKNCLPQNVSSARVEKLELGEDREIWRDW